eukprot:SAG31_NODE_5324_length_2609_cov_2.399557_1_plen_179_part_00
MLVWSCVVVSTFPAAHICVIRKLRGSHQVQTAKCVTPVTAALGAVILRMVGAQRPFGRQPKDSLAVPSVALSIVSICTTIMPHDKPIMHSADGCADTEAFYVEHGYDHPVRHPPAFLGQGSTADENADLCACKVILTSRSSHVERNDLRLTLMLLVVEELPRNVNCTWRRFDTDSRGP